MGEPYFALLTAKFGDLREAQGRKFIDRANEQLRVTGTEGSLPDEPSLAELARRIYLLGLLRGIEIKRASTSRADKSGPPSPQHRFIERALDELASSLPLKGFGIVTEHENHVAHFCTHKVRGTHKTRDGKKDCHGFYLLCALYVLREETEGRFNPLDCKHLVPQSEINLAHRIFLFLARRLNELADTGKAPLFPDVLPARPDTALSRIPFFYLQHSQHAKDAERLYDLYKTPRLPDKSFGDDCAHFILYRSRRSNPLDVMKSFLVIKKLREDPYDKRVQHHPTFHVYQAPRDLAGGAWGTPGRILPLKSGVFIVGGQHARELETRTGRVREAGAPFRSLEVIFLPWESFDSEPLAGGLMMSVNKDGDPLVGRFCIRPTLIQRAEQAGLGAIALAGDERLAVEIEKDWDAELELASLAKNVDTSSFLDLYHRFSNDRDNETVRKANAAQRIANRIAELCNNNSDDAWKLLPGIKKDSGKPLRDNDIQGLIDEALAGAVDAAGKPFSLQRDLRIAPLTSF